MASSLDASMPVYPLYISGVIVDSSNSKKNSDVAHTNQERGRKGSATDVSPPMKLSLGFTFALHVRYKRWYGREDKDIIFEPEDMFCMCGTRVRQSENNNHCALVLIAHGICICDTPPDILTRAQARTTVLKKPVRALCNPLNPDGTRRLVAGCRKQPIYVMPAVHPPPAINPQQPSFHLSKLLRFSPRTNALWPSRNNQPRS
ncbi:hypothetical protein EDD22DRAFT_951851 [Suillus occidentalis]|nr:hypothetical protein EDD22DRAFT_951851 [Suillus occidentalis]